MTTAVLPSTLCTRNQHNNRYQRQTKTWYNRKSTSQQDFGVKINSLGNKITLDHDYGSQDYLVTGLWQSRLLGNRILVAKQLLAVHGLGEDGLNVQRFAALLLCQCKRLDALAFAAASWTRYHDLCR